MTALSSFAVSFFVRHLRPGPLQKRLIYAHDAGGLTAWHGCDEGLLPSSTARPERLPESLYFETGSKGQQRDGLAPC